METTGIGEQCSYNILCKHFTDQTRFIKLSRSHPLFRRKWIDDAVFTLSQESYDQSLKNLLNPHANGNGIWHQMDGWESSLMEQFELLELLSNRRGLKLSSAINAMPPKTRSIAIRKAFEYIRDKHKQKVSAKSGCYNECLALGWVLYTAADNCSASDYLAIFDEILTLRKSFLNQILQINGGDVGVRLTYHIYPDERVLLNSATLKLRKMGLGSASNFLVLDLKKERLPLYAWNDPETFFDVYSSGRLLKIDGTLPSFAQFSSGWRELVIYDWPDEWKMADGESKQQKRVHELMEVMRTAARKEE